LTFKPARAIMQRS